MKVLGGVVFFLPWEKLCYFASSLKKFTEKGGEMSIRALARDVYKAVQAVETLNKKLEAAAPGEEDSLRRELQMAEKELTILRRMLAGEKESGEFRKKFSGFGGL